MSNNEVTNKKTLVGSVIKVISNKTIVVGVVFYTQHWLYVKTIKKHKKFMCHCDDNIIVSVGDNVSIVETRPISKRKSWKIFSVMDKYKKNT